MARSENAVARQVCQWLRFHNFAELDSKSRPQVLALLEHAPGDVAGVFWRANTGGMSGKNKGKPWYVGFGVAGQPDFMGITSGGQFFGIETKAKTKQSPEQIEFEKIMRRCGAIYILARSAADLEGTELDRD